MNPIERRRAQRRADKGLSGPGAPYQTLTRQNARLEREKAELEQTLEQLKRQYGGMMDKFRRLAPVKHEVIGHIVPGIVTIRVSSPAGNYTSHVEISDVSISMARDRRGMEAMVRAEVERKYYEGIFAEADRMFVWGQKAEVLRERNKELARQERIAAQHGLPNPKVWP